MLHISADKVVRKRDILMIVDLQNEENAETESFLEHLKKRGRVQRCQNEKSVVIVTQGKEVMAYYSPISALTLMHRSNERQIYKDK